MWKWERSTANARVLASHQRLDLFRLLADWSEPWESVQRIPGLSQQQVLSSAHCDAHATELGA
jgi:hypothetical protein